ncbi:STAS/SEC14 domain-containing protein [Chitinophaga sedimenti]|uniref:STAS/SEC14 domain-containing protein n=1 Tax=Chitinophaga sedimenti TaxID=2033606 RepID=UPI0020047076|nr:STAS/SEC14 domain-containing protein [Chitinophaga sedimenti]MCK7556274.1 STAS/SEC14 domain-containing protein [Chitinophaga sedimenti]
MVALLPDYPPHVAAYRASGSVSQEEYQQVVMQRVEQVADIYGKINFLVLLDTDFSNYSIGALLKYLYISFRHFFKWERMAIVSEEAWVRRAYDMLSPLVHGEVRGFKHEELAEAKQWVSGPLKT